MEQVIKKHDIFILFVLLRSGPQREVSDANEWTYDELSRALGIAKSETYRSLKRSASSHLFDMESRRVRKEELLEFVEHGSSIRVRRDSGRIGTRNGDLVERSRT